MHGIHKGHPEDGRRGWVQTDGEYVSVHVIAAELGNQAVGHEVSVSESRNDRLKAARVVQERSHGRE